MTPEQIVQARDLAREWKPRGRTNSLETNYIALVRG